MRPDCDHKLAFHIYQAVPSLFLQQLLCKKMGKFGDIPNEILVKVFDYIEERSELQECQFTCRKWS